ncbi:MAG: hypothetical protein Q9178_005509 [Gyalolechia marmorata]
MDRRKSPPVKFQMPRLASARSQASNGDERSCRGTDCDNVPKGPSQNRVSNETTGMKRRSPARVDGAQSKRSRPDFNSPARDDSSLDARQNNDQIAKVQADTSRVDSEKLRRDNANDSRDHSTKLAQAILPSTQASAFSRRRQQIEQKNREYTEELAELKLRHAELEVNKSHLREEEKAYDQFECKRKDLSRKREDIGRQYSEQIKEVDCQSEEVERQCEHELQAMNERYAREIADLRQQQKRKPGSAPMNPSPSKPSRELKSGRSGEQNQP